MSLELNNENAMKAYCAVLACTGIGAAKNNCDEVLTKTVKVVVPVSTHDDYTARLLACANQVCTDEPYVWRVDQTEPPALTDETVFQNLYDDWFKNIIWPV